MSSRPRIKVARVYEDPDPDDGQRVLVDRFWPTCWHSVQAFALFITGVLQLST